MKSWRRKERGRKRRPGGDERRESVTLALPCFSLVFFKFIFWERFSFGAGVLLFLLGMGG